MHNFDEDGDDKLARREHLVHGVASARGEERAAGPSEPHRREPSPKMGSG